MTENNKRKTPEEIHRHKSSEQIRLKLANGFTFATNPKRDKTSFIRTKLASIVSYDEVG